MAGCLPCTSGCGDSCRTGKTHYHWHIFPLRTGMCCELDTIGFEVAGCAIFRGLNTTGRLFLDPSHGIVPVGSSPSAVISVQDKYHSNIPCWTSNPPSPTILSHQGLSLPFRVKALPKRGIHLATSLLREINSQAGQLANLTIIPQPSANLIITLKESMSLTDKEKLNYEYIISPPFARPNFPF